jgi:hypothetical protein
VETKPFLIAVLIGLAAAPAGAAAVSNSASGAWSSPSTWVGNAVPTRNDTVTIVANSTVTVDAVGLQSSTVTVNGTIRFSTSAFSSLTLVGGNMTIASGGFLSRGRKPPPSVLPSGRSLFWPTERRRGNTG